MIYNNNRKSYIDILKTIAIVSVIFCHLQLNDVIGTNVWFIRCDNIILDRLWYVLGYSFANLSIPMFMLLTGANRFRNIENENIDYNKLFKEIIKIIVLFVIFQIPLYAYKHFKHGYILSIKDYVVTMYSSNVEPIYWYFTGFYLAFLFSFPLLKKFTINASKHDYEYLFIVYAAVQLIVNNILKFHNININIPLSIFSYVYMYPLFGDLICNKYSDSDFSISKVIVLIVCALVYRFANEPYDAMNIYIAILVLISFRKLSLINSDFESLKKTSVYFILEFSGKFALLFYLFHPYLIRLAYRLSNSLYPNSIMYLDYVIGIIFMIVNFVLTFVIIYILVYFTQKIKLLRKMQ